MAGYNHWTQIANNMKQGAKEAVTETAKYIANVYTANAPRRTGFMGDSSYYRTSEESTYGQGAGAPPKDAYLLPEVDAPPDEYTAYAAVAANYAIFQELGTRFMPAQPAFYPAMDEAQPLFDANLAKIDSGLSGSIS